MTNTPELTEAMMEAAIQYVATHPFKGAGTGREWVGGMYLAMQSARVPAPSGDDRVRVGKAIFAVTADQIGKDPTWATLSKSSQEKVLQVADAAIAALSGGGR